MQHEAGMSDASDETSRYALLGLSVERWAVRGYSDAGDERDLQPHTSICTQGRHAHRRALNSQALSAKKRRAASYAAFCPACT